jgi:sugar phosphate isomerase/epimerase
MVVYQSIYEGGGYSLDPKYSLAVDSQYASPTSSFALALDPRTANQLKEVSDKTNTGAKMLEFQGTFSKQLEAIPEQHLDEVRRQTKLTGVKLTMHGPMEEPSGFTSGQGGSEWREENRQHVERQFTQALERANKLDPKGNIIVTLHSTAQLPEMLQREKVKGKEQVKSVYVVDSRTGRVGQLKEELKYFPQEKDQKSYKFNPDNELKRLNKDNWFNQLDQAVYHMDIATQRSSRDEIPKGVQLAQDMIDSGKVTTEEMIAKQPELKEHLLALNNVGRSEGIYVRNSYQELKKLYDEAYHSAVELGRKEDIKKLDGFREEVKKNWDQIESEKPNLRILKKVVEEGVDTLRDLDESPQVFKRLQNFIIDKSSDTFSNVALNTYNKFGNNSPIISIENPPAGQGLSRAEDMKELVDESRKKFVEKLRNEGHSRSDAKAIAEKLIGVTWDVGHINMIRKFGYEKEDLLKEAKTIKPYLKHIHLSDNFGFEHTELPMGMGNVPIKETAKVFGKKFKNISKAIETGDWYQHFQTTPFQYELSAFGSSVGAGEAKWNQVAWGYAPYFAGYGTVNPDIHHQIYGRGFSGLPQELGGQMPGTESSRTTGTPMA